MRARVNAAIEELKYRPHAGARAMRGRSYNVGVVLVELSSPFGPEIAQGVGNELEATQYQELLVAAGRDEARYKRLIEALVSLPVDGLVLVAPRLNADWLDEAASETPTVAVALHGGTGAFDTVVDDDRLGARLMVDHLVALGHRRIVYTSMPSGTFEDRYVLSHTARRQGFNDAMHDHGLETDVIETWYSEEGGYSAAIEALSRPERPTAIFAGADVAALGVLRAASELGLNVPQDLSVAGYDNIFASALTGISLTTIDQAGARTGAITGQLLIERMQGPHRASAPLDRTPTGSSPHDRATCVRRAEAALSRTRT